MKTGDIQFHLPNLNDIVGPVSQRLDQNAIQRISVNKTNHAIHWIVIDLSGGLDYKNSLFRLVHRA